MKQFTKISTVLIALSLTSHAIAADDTIRYKNKRGSLLELHFGQTSDLSGTFTTAVARKECQEAIGVKQPIIGYVNGTAVTFSVSYPQCGSVVTFIGHISQEKDTIEAIALIAQQDSLFNKGAGTESISHDFFTKEN